MTRGSSPMARRFVVLSLIWAIAGACSSVQPTPPPSGPVVPSGSNGASQSTVPSASLNPSGSSVESVSPSPGGSSSASPAACSRLPVTGPLPGNRLTRLVVSADVGFDRIALTVEPSPGPAPVGPARPTATLEEATPPFVHGASGLPLDVRGERFVRLTMRNMVIVDDAGQPVYDGPAEFDTGGPFVRQVVNAESFEGVIQWVAGLAADAACIAVGRTADGTTITIDISGD